MIINLMKCYGVLGHEKNLFMQNFQQCSYSKKQFNNFTEGDCICGENASPEELKRWTGDQYDLAKAELAKYSCSYRKSGGYMFADEYALEYCNTDEDGEFLDGSDLDLAEKEA